MKEEMIKIKISDKDAAAVAAVLIKKRLRGKFKDTGAPESLMRGLEMSDFAAELLATLTDKDAVKRILEEREDD